MPADPPGAPPVLLHGSGATYHGFSGSPSGPPPTVSRPPLRPPRAALIGGLAAIAIVLGLGAGLILRPGHQALSSADPAEAAVKQPMPIEVNRPAPPPALPQPAGKLEVLNPATAEAARAAQPAAVQAAPALPAPTPVAETPPPASALDRCAGASSRAAALVCADPRLAAYDRDLNRAYRRAMQSGAVSPQDLRADQRDWLDVREQAAARSPRALADVYEERIDELNRIADDGPGDDRN